MHISRWIYKEVVVNIQKEHYSATERHIFVSLLMRQFNLQSIIQSEKS